MITIPAFPARMIHVARLVDELGREELEMKKLGLVNHALGVRKAIITILRMADSGEPSIDPSEPT